MKTPRLPVISSILTGILLLFLSQGCTIVNYCAGKQIDEKRAENHSFRAGENFKVNRLQHVEVITLTGESIHGTFAGLIVIRPEMQESFLATYLEEFRPMIVMTDYNGMGTPDTAGISAPVQRNQTICYRIIKKDNTLVDIPEDEILMMKADYGRKGFWSRMLPAAGIVADIFLVLLIKGVIPAG